MSNDQLITNFTDGLCAGVHVNYAKRLVVIDAEDGGIPQRFRLEFKRCDKILFYEEDPLDDEYGDTRSLLDIGELSVNEESIITKLSSLIEQDGEAVAKRVFRIAFFDSGVLEISCANFTITPIPGFESGVDWEGIPFVENDPVDKTSADGSGS